MTTTTKPCKITQTHCENCGSTDHFDVFGGSEGYTACCNELTATSRDCRNHHAALEAGAK